MSVENLAEQEKAGFKFKPDQNSTRRGFLRKLGAVTTGMVFMSAEAEASNILIPEGGKIEEKKKGDGSVEYKHSDPETTHILEVVSGYAEATSEDRYKLLRAMFIDTDIKNKKDINSSVEKWSKLSNLEIMGQYLTEKYSGIFKPSASNMLGVKELGPVIYEVFSAHPELLFPVKKHSPNKKVYNALWQAEKRLNNPKINWGVKPESGSGLRSLISKVVGKGLVKLNGARYAPAINTLFINELNFSDWISLGEFYLPESKKVVTGDEYKVIEETSEIIQARLKDQVAFERKIKDLVEKSFVRAMLILLDADYKALKLVDLELEAKFGIKYLEANRYTNPEIENFKKSLINNADFQNKKRGVIEKAVQDAKQALKSELSKVVLEVKNG